MPVRSLDVLLGAGGLFGQRFCKRPELAYRHFEVAANRKHDVAGYICFATLDPPQIVIAITERSRQTGLREVL